MKKLVLIGLALLSLNAAAQKVILADYIKMCPRCCTPFEQPDPCCQKRLCHH
jgi:hypothetical protein